MQPPLRQLLAASLVAGCLLLGACASSRETPGPRPPPAAPPAETPAPETRPADPPTAEAPPARPARPTTRTVQGFRIQVVTTSEKAAADAHVEQVLAWWRTVPSAKRPAYLKSNDLPVEIKWQQPYYRVRLGGFATRDEAQRALALVQERFSKAFIVPDTVTLTR
jgi:hypothetical protein